MISNTKYINFFALVISTVMLCGCEPEEQDFTYEDVNELEFSSELTDFEVVQFDDLEIAPTVTPTLEDGRSYSYEWLAYPNNGDVSEIITLSEDKNLNETIGLDVGGYTIQYNVTDNQTGIVYTERYSLRVNSGFYEGWLVAHNTNGNGQLSFIRIDGLVIENPIEQINNKTYPGLVYDASAALQQVYYFSEEGIYMFDSNSFAEVGASSDIFGSHVTSNSRADVTEGSLGLVIYLINNGEIHLSSMFFGFDGAYSPALVGDHNVFPFSFANQDFNALFGNTYFYDNNNQRFLLSGYSNTNLQMAPGTPDSPYFDMANTNVTMLAAAKGGGSLYHALMEDENNNYYIYSLASGLPAGRNMVDFPGLNEVKGFDALSQGANLIYFGIENILYKYDVASNTIEDIYTFPSGGSISDVKVYKNPYQYFPTIPSDPGHNQRIAVAVNNGAEGEVYFFDLTGTGNLVEDTYAERYSGFGEIATISYRHR